MDTFRSGGSHSQRLLSTDEDFVLLSEKRKNKKALQENGNENEDSGTHVGDYQAPSGANLLIRNDMSRVVSKSVSNTDSMIWDNPNAGEFKMFDSRRDSEQSELRIIAAQMNTNRDRNVTNATNVTNVTNFTNRLNTNPNIHFSSKGNKFNNKFSDGSVSEMTRILHKNSSNVANVGSAGAGYVIAINGTNDTTAQKLLSAVSANGQYYNMDHLNNNENNNSNHHHNNKNNNNNKKNNLSSNNNNNNNNSFDRKKPKRSQTYDRDRLEQSQSDGHGGGGGKMNQKLRSYSQNQSENRDKNNNFNFSNDLVIHDNKLHDTLGNKSGGTITSGYDENLDKLLSGTGGCPWWLWLCCPILCPIGIIYVCWVSFVNPRCFISFTILFHLLLDWLDEVTDILFVIWLYDTNRKDPEKIEDYNEVFYLFVGGIVLNHCCNFVYCIIVRNLWRFDEAYLTQFPYLRREIKNVSRLKQCFLVLFSGILNCSTFNFICKSLYVRNNAHSINQIYIEYNYPCSPLKRNKYEAQENKAYFERLKQLDSTIIQTEFTNMLEKEAMHSPLLVLVQLIETILKIVSFCLLYYSFSSIGEWIGSEIIVTKVIVTLICLITQFKGCTIACDDYTFIEKYAHD